MARRLGGMGGFGEATRKETEGGRIRERSASRLEGSAKMKSVVACGVVVVALGVVGCEEKKKEAATAPVAETGGGGAAVVDWSRVSAKPLTETVGPVSRVCRRMDAEHKGAVRELVLTYGEGGAKDQAGFVYAITPEEWKGIVEMVERNPAKKGAGRAMPGDALDHKDGLGAVARHAYEVEVVTSPLVVRFTVVKKIEGDSKG